MKDQDSFFEGILRRIKNNRVVAVLIVAGTIVISLSTFSDAAKHLIDLVVGQSQESARHELSELGLPYSEQAFIDCIDQGDLRAVKLFLRAGIDPNTSDEDGNTALMHAVDKRHAEIIDLLLKAKANVNKGAKDGGTALSWAVGQGNLELVRLLLDHGADPQTVVSAFLAAAHDGEAKLMILLTERGVPLNEVGSEALLDATHNVAVVSDQKQNEAVTFLLSRGVDVNTKDKEGWTPLMMAANDSNSMPLVLRTLLDHGANVNAQCICSGWLAGGWTALMLAAYGGHDDIVKILVAKPSNVNLKNNEGRTALAVASDRGHADVVRTLLANGADVNERDNEGMTVLMLASVSGSKTVVRTLLEEGAHVSDKDKHGRAAMQLAKLTERTDIIPLLQEAKK